jgi:hypothetical protein
MRKILTFLAVFLVVAGFSTTSMAIKHDRDLRDKVEDLVNFEYNEEIFTVGAFLNYTGMDRENYEFTEIREKVRDDLDDMDIDIIDDEYFTNHKFYESEYYYMIMNYLGDAPDFNVKKNVRYYTKKDLEALSEALSEFYKEADISELYEKYEDDIKDYIEDAEESAYDDFEYTFKTLNLDIDDVDSIEIYIEPLMSTCSGFNVSPVERRGEEIIIVSGIDAENDYTYNALNGVHELLHSYVNPIIDENFRKKAKDLYNELKNDKKGIDTGGFKDDEAIKEAYVRSLSRIIYRDIDEMLETTYGGSSEKFRICDDIVKDFSEMYDPDEFDLEEFIGESIEDLYDDIDEDDNVELENVLSKDKEEDDEYIKIAKDQIIVIDYNDILRRKTVDDDNIKMYNEDGDEMDITPFYNYDSILILQNENYEEGEVYILEIEDIEDKDRDDIRDKILKFEIIED